MQQIFKGMDNGASAINQNFNELSTGSFGDVDQTVKSITAKNWSTFQSGLESFSGFKSHGWANFDYVANSGDQLIDGKIISKPQTKIVKIGQLTATISRFGSVVFVSIDTQSWPYSGATAWTVAYDMVIPAGYRPVGTASMTMINNFKMSSLKVNSNGAIFFTDTDVSSSTNFEAYGTWITNDDWEN